MSAAPGRSVVYAAGLPGGCPRASVALLFGGASDERAVSLETARAIRASLQQDDDGRGPARIASVDWLPSGEFTIDGRRHPAADGLASLAQFDVVLLAVHGGAGEDGTLQGALESVGARYTGSGVAASALALSKGHSIAVARGLGLAVPEGLSVARDEWRQARGAWLDRLATLGGSGWMVKPDRGGSSLGARRVPAGSGLEAALNQAFDDTDRLRVEAVVEGVELTCAVVGEGSGARALMPVEIVPDDGRFFDFEQKYDGQGAAERCPPQLVGAEVIDRLQQDAVKVHRDFGCRGLTRSDFLVGADGQCTFLELNTLPGLTPRSLAPQAAAFHGLSHRDLCLALIEAALAPQGG